MVSLSPVPFVWSHLTCSTLSPFSDPYFWTFFHAGQRCLESFTDPFVSRRPFLDLHPHLTAKEPSLHVKATQGRSQVRKKSEKCTTSGHSWRKNDLKIYSSHLSRNYAETLAWRSQWMGTGSLAWGTVRQEDSVQQRTTRQWHTLANMATLAKSKDLRGRAFLPR